MSNRLDDLQPDVRPVFFEMLARLTEARIPVVIAFTGRTQAEQDEAFRTGHSKVKHSKHQDGLAIDVVPYFQYTIHGSNKLQYDTADPVWKQIGEIGEALGLRWGGRFRPLNKNGVGWDPGHFEYVR